MKKVWLPHQLASCIEHTDSLLSRNIFCFQFSIVYEVSMFIFWCSSPQFFRELIRRYSCQLGYITHGQKIMQKQNAQQIQQDLFGNAADVHKHKKKPWFALEPRFLLWWGLCLRLDAVKQIIMRTSHLFLRLKTAAGLMQKHRNWNDFQSARLQVWPLDMTTTQECSNELETYSRPNYIVLALSTINTRVTTAAGGPQNAAVLSGGELWWSILVNRESNQMNDSQV